MARIICIGESMLELSQAGAGWNLSYAGDTLNTAVHLARDGHDVAYMTALGVDPFSQKLQTGMEEEGLDTSLVLPHPHRQAGLYAISLDEEGERSFSYWRDTSAAREMFDLPQMVQAVEKAATADLICFSLISLAILPTLGRNALLDLARQVRSRGGHVAFDGNYRARLWSSATEAALARDAAIGCASFGFPTREDEASISGGEASAEQIAAHWQSLGCAETVVKLGAEGCRLPDGTIVPPPVALKPVDTSGAGDAFNAGYLSARLQGADSTSAALAGHATAGWTIMRPGAIPPRDI
ncbi:sugar kinase [Novosphingobium sp. RD2P27]|uniref:Sugar kinase n=1 Tax=Novosphingobium kalidii TaxID=3230299 RepID=A0ABV2D1C7_9SPHN